jgi:hypothetical protein
VILLCVLRVSFVNMSCRVFCFSHVFAPSFPGRANPPSFVEGHGGRRQREGYSERTRVTLVLCRAFVQRHTCTEGGREGDQFNVTLSVFVFRYFEPLRVA